MTNFQRKTLSLEESQEEKIRQEPQIPLKDTSL
jgi:hypothetical protein